MQQTTYPIYEECQVSENLRMIFNKRFSSDDIRCDFIVRAPGRVNIIGEHIDYNGYPVLPMALNKAIYAAAGKHKRLNTVMIKSEDETLESYSGIIDDFLKFDAIGPSLPFKWFHYALCGYRAIYDYASIKYSDWVAPPLCLLVGQGPIAAYLPQCAGLSSSSALVVAAALATMRISGIEIDAVLLADLCAKSENLIGTQGGGMDQAACLLANEAPLLIEFTKPALTLQPVRIPAGGVFVIADSCARMHKAVTPEFNQRVAECRQAAQVLLAKLHNNRKIHDVKKLFEVQGLWKKSSPNEMIQGDDSPYMQAFKDTEDSLPALRAKHVFSEANRVLCFQKLCCSHQLTNPTGDDTLKTNDDILVQLGELMNASQESCRDFYDCSSPEVDKLVNVCRSSGSLGSRLTGAGWGGCVISLVRESRLPHFIDDVARGFFGKAQDELNSQLFSTLPGRAAGFYL